MIARLTIKSLNAVEALKRVSQDEEGAAMVEYGLLVALIALVAVVGVTATGTKLSALFTNISNKLVIPGT